MGLCRGAALAHRLQQAVQLSKIAHPRLPGAGHGVHLGKAQAVHRFQDELVAASGDKEAPQPVGQAPKFGGAIRVHVAEDPQGDGPVLAGAQSHPVAVEGVAQQNTGL